MISVWLSNLWSGSPSISSDLPCIRSAPFIDIYSLVIVHSFSLKRADFRSCCIFVLSPLGRSRRYGRKIESHPAKVIQTFSSPSSCPCFLIACMSSYIWPNC